MPSLPEPWRVKVVEPIRLPDPVEREEHLRRAGFNLFAVPSEAIFIDLLTDSGTSALSDAQWGRMMTADEAYAGARSYYRFEETVQRIFGFPEVIPVHQGRAGERVLFAELVEPGMVVPNNCHFDTTRANVEHRGGIARDLVIAEGREPAAGHPFKGNMDLQRLRTLLEEAAPGQVPMVLLTLTNNSAGGQPVSLANVRGCAAICRELGVPLFIDACRFAENAWFIRQREPGQGRRPVAEIVRDIFRLADGCIMSAKKDGLANIGGFIAVRDSDLAARLRQQLVVGEGFPTYGGLAGRDLEAVARGLEEVLQEDYLRFRIEQVAWLGERLHEQGIPIFRPVGGHAVYIDAGELLPHIPPQRFPGQALTVALYRHGAIRGVEIGSVMFGGEDPETGEFLPAPLELVRLAVPRRVYSHRHLGFVAEVLGEIRQRRDELVGLAMILAPPVLRHFSARFEELAAGDEMLPAAVARRAAAG